MKTTTLGKPFGVRLPIDLRNWIESRSIRNHRSMSSEIVAILTAIRDREADGSDLEKFASPSR